MIRRLAVPFTMLVLLGAGVRALADMPAELKGVWVLNVEATRAFVKTSPKWKAEDEAMVPRILERMSQVTYEFSDDAVVITMGERTERLPLSLEKRAGKAYVFLGRIQETEVRLTVSLDDKGNLNIKTSGTDDMDYYLWKRKPKGAW